jgi:uncharacterized protein (DUF849 family)
MSGKVIVTCALIGVLTDPARHHVPVPPEAMAREARAAFEAGASVVHVHLREQIDALVAIARAAGRDCATPAEAGALPHLWA